VDIAVQTAASTFTVRGEAHNDVNLFYGIPFSKPRTPPHRFEPPEDYEHAPGAIYLAKDQKHECVQSSGAGSEDCLYLDIYMPTSASTANTKPVLVWIHGGSWMTGSKNEYSGALWASQQWTDDVDRVVVVTINYRMNILGNPDHDGIPKNLGMKDCIHALRWVKDHIGNFGGDTNAITIFGESAGSMNVVQLWGSPAARGLFHRAIAQSPYIWSYTYGTPIPDESFWVTKREKQSECLENAQATACASLPGGVSDPSCSVQTPTLDEMTSAGCFGRWYGPMAEEDIISTTFHKDWCGSVDVGAGVPLLVGHNELEVNLWSLLGAYPNKNTQMRTWVDHLAPLSNGTAVFQCLGDLYKASGRLQDPFKPAGRHDGTQEEVYATSGVFFNIISQTLAQLPNVHLFLFNESADHTGYNLCQNPLGAHTCEVPFVITDLAKYDLNGTNAGFGAPMDTAVQRNMRKAWANFATTGNPGWAHDEVGIFMDEELEIRGNRDAFIPAASTLLTKLMCHPASIAPTCPIPETHTCGDMKRLFRRNHCCGNPGKTFHM
jgi:carboxylesterase type B